MDQGLSKMISIQLCSKSMSNVKKLQVEKYFELKIFFELFVCFLVLSLKFICIILHTKPIVIANGYLVAIIVEFQSNHAAVFYLNFFFFQFRVEMRA